jgi:hypothetical protein
LAPQGVAWSGAPGASAELYIAHAVRLALLDGDRTLAIAVARSVRGEYEPMTTLAIALGVLSSLAPNADRWRNFETIQTRDGVVTSFRKATTTYHATAKAIGGTLRHDDYELKYDGDGKVSAVLVAGAPPRLGSIRFARKDSYAGIVLLVSGAPNPKATLVWVDGEAQASELAPPVALPSDPAGHRVSLSVRGQVVSAVVGDKKLEAKLTRPAGKGRIGLVTAHSGRIEVDGFGPGPTAPPKPKAKP